MVEEAGEELGAQIGEPEAVCRQCTSLLGIAQQQHEGVAIGRNRTRTQGALLQHVRTEELLHQRGEGRGRLVAHDALPGTVKRSNLAPIESMSSGTPLRYQYVSEILA